MDRQRGFSLVEMLVVVGLVSGALLALGAVRGTQAPRVHAAALGLQAALAEAKALAASNARAVGSGATVSVVPEQAGTVVAVYASRPIAGNRAPSSDAGFPPQRFDVAMNLGGASAAQPFAIFVSSSGYASVAPGYAYNPLAPVFLSADPGCDEAAGVTITIGDGAAGETHPLDCRETQYEAETATIARSGG